MISHIVSAMKPSLITIVMKKSESDSRSKIFKLFDDCNIRETELSGDYGTVHINVSHRDISRTSKKELRIIFNSSIPEKFQETKLSAARLKTPSEVADSPDLPELSPISFISFHNSKWLSDVCCCFLNFNGVACFLIFFFCLFSSSYGGKEEEVRPMCQYDVFS